jgi:hypothetical protein
MEPSPGYSGNTKYNPKMMISQRKSGISMFLHFSAPPGETFFISE